MERNSACFSLYNYSPEKLAANGTPKLPDVGDTYRIWANKVTVNQVFPVYILTGHMELSHNITLT